jgi:hypothetical protein
LAWQKDQVTMTRWMRSLADAQIDAARMRGDFDNLRGKGKPLELDELDGLSAEQRFEALLLRSLGEVAPELALIRAIRTGRAQLATCAEPLERKRLEGVLGAQVSELTAALKARRNPAS